MTIQVNGSSHTTSVSLTVRGLLDELGFGLKPVIVELNRRALFPREHAEAELKEGDVIEIVQITAGG
ncbi:MAG: sulfur carrier protein ThiS [Verrucomicrobia bacterium]|nr:sulfur carrier protein ThiS [Verrucomicrobiota bacterium]